MELDGGETVRGNWGGILIMAAVKKRKGAKTRERRGASGL